MLEQVYNEMSKVIAIFVSMDGSENWSSPKLINMDFMPPLVLPIRHSVGKCR